MTSEGYGSVRPVSSVSASRSSVQIKQSHVWCREAARKASAYAEDGTYLETKEALRLPAFEKVIDFAVQKALEDWRDEALEGEWVLCTMAVTVKLLQYDSGMIAQSLGVTVSKGQTNSAC